MTIKTLFRVRGLGLELGYNYIYISKFKSPSNLEKKDSTLMIRRITSKYDDASGGNKKNQLDLL